MIIKKRAVILSFSFAAFMLILFSNTNLKSNKLQPLAYYANNPNPPQPTQNCSYCHACVPSHDSTNFVLQMGADTLSLANVASGVTEYMPGALYYMRVTATRTSAVYGFEFTAEDTANSGINVTNFDILNPTTTSLISVSYKFVAHHNASSNNQWTFKWTAPTAYSGPITFYYVGNDGNNDDDDTGDQIYIMTKTINAVAVSGITDIGDKLNGLSVFPTVFNQNIQIAFNLKENAKVQGSIIDLNGRVVMGILNEGLTAGSFNRQFDLNGLAAGVYLVKIQIGDAYTVSKIVKD